MKETKNFLEKLKRVRSLQDLKKLLSENGKGLKKLALPIIVIAIIFSQYIGGGEKDVAEQIPETEILSQETTISKLYVDISGEVRCPGVYEVDDGARLFNVVELAGGLTQDASTQNINQAEMVVDGQKIYIPSIDEEQNYENQTYSDSSTQVNSSMMKNQEGKININYADDTTLQEIPGIGPSKSQKIVQYREANGKFNSIDELINISGIGEKTLENMKPYITV